MTGYILNPDVERRNEVRQAIRNNDGYCPCSVVKTPETKCPCAEFRCGEGCQCGLYVPKENNP